GWVTAAPPTLSAASVVLMDGQSGRVLYAKDEHSKRPMASLTKIMTAALALEYGQLDELATASTKAVNMEPSSIYLKEGEQIPLIDLVYGAILRSGNDAAMVIAEHIGGSQENFARLMNERALSIGCRSTSFQNPHGLDQKNHYSTAYDMALIARYAMSVPGFAEIAATKKKTIAGQRIVTNKNETLTKVVGGDGVKIGFTDNAGRCLAASASRDGNRLIAVVLNDGNWFNDCAALLNWGFEQVRFMPVVREGEMIKTVAVTGGKESSLPLAAWEDYYLPLKEGEDGEIYTSWSVPQSVPAPIKEGQQIGEMVVYLKDQPMGTVPLVAMRSVETKPLSWWAKLWLWLGGKRS
ncbi:MAG: D-alanyl-D-alanine carboxypeptidase family protein, partial [Bacillota bacterium]